MDKYAINNDLGKETQPTSDRPMKIVDTSLATRILRKRSEGRGENTEKAPKNSR